MERRWLFPFTHAGDVRALEVVVHMANAANATLVLVALFVSSEHRGQEECRECMAQISDVLAYGSSLAASCQVAIECYSVFTGDFRTSVKALVQELGCSSIVIVKSEQQHKFLWAHELATLTTRPPVSLVIAQPGIQQQKRRQPDLRMSPFPWATVRRWLSQLSSWQGHARQKPGLWTEADILWTQEEEEAAICVDRAFEAGQQHEHSRPCGEAEIACPLHNRKLPLS